MRLIVLLVVLLGVGWLWRLVSPPGGEPSWTAIGIIIAVILFITSALTAGKYK